MLQDVFTLSAQSQRGLKGSFDFNEASTLNKVTAHYAKAIGTYFTEDRFGNAEKAIYIQGNRGSYLNLGTATSLKPRVGSISMWVNIENINYQGVGYEHNPFILTKNCDCDNFYEAYSIGLNYSNNKISGGASFSEYKQVSSISTFKIKTNRWYHYVLAYNDDTLYFYINGALQGALFKGFPTQFSANDSVMVGYTANKKNERFLIGAVDDIFIYNRVLNSEEVKALYNAPNPNRIKNFLYLFFKWIGVAAGLAILVWLFVRRSKKELRLKQERTEMQSKLNEMETRAIRMQMNPHFVFNALNSLQRLILEENTESAYTYLLKFSVLLRRILESADSEHISLQEELEILEAYINIEKIRFDHTFEYTIYSEVKNPHQVFIPFMLIQPMIENAIWHGLLPKKDNKQLSIRFKTLDEYFISCEVEDNGVGRAHIAHKASEEPLKRSMSIGFINQRFEMIYKMTGKKGFLTFSDKFHSDKHSAGTKVTIIIPTQ